MEPNKRLAVIVGRFQVDDLHKGHRHLIQMAIDNSDKVCIFVGIPHNQRPNVNNPLDYLTRMFMLLDRYPEVCIHPIIDHESDREWSYDLDRRLEYYKDYDIVLYGSRHSFVENYYGHYPCIVVPEIQSTSGTEGRNNLKPVYNRDYRIGVIDTINKLNKNNYGSISNIKF